MERDAFVEMMRIFCGSLWSTPKWSFEPTSKGYEIRYWFGDDSTVDARIIVLPNRTDPFHVQVEFAAKIAELRHPTSYSNRVEFMKAVLEGNFEWLVLNVVFRVILDETKSVVADLLDDADEEVS